MNIVLIGYRGSGKTTIGRLLAEDLQRRFVDTDVLIAERAGRSIRDIFQQQGEEAFRDLESAVITHAAAEDGHVIAVGGGAILRPQNVAALKDHGRIIWLEAEAAVLHARIVADAGTIRPNLTAAGGLEEVRELLERRRPLYEAAADFTVEAGDILAGEAVRRVKLVLGLCDQSGKLT